MRSSALLIFLSLYILMFTCGPCGRTFRDTRGRTVYQKSCSKRREANQRAHKVLQAVCTAQTKPKEEVKAKIMRMDDLWESQRERGKAREAIGDLVSTMLAPASRGDCNSISHLIHFLLSSCTAYTRSDMFLLYRTFRTMVLYSVRQCRPAPSLPGRIQLACQHLNCLPYCLRCLPLHHRHQF